MKKVLDPISKLFISLKAKAQRKVLTEELFPGAGK